MSYITTVQFNGENCSGRSFAGTWKVGSSITRGSFLSTPSPWKQQEDFWAQLIDSFISWLHWDMIHLDTQLISKEEVVQRGSSIISSTIAYQRQLLSGRISPPKGEDVWQADCQSLMELPDTSPLVLTGKIRSCKMFWSEMSKRGFEKNWWLFKSHHCMNGLKYSPSKTAVIWTEWPSVAQTIWEHYRFLVWRSGEWVQDQALAVDCSESLP